MTSWANSDVSPVGSVAVALIAYERRVPATACVGAVLDPETLRGFCAETLSSYKVPVDLEIGTTPLPRNATGKVMKHVLAGTSASAFVDEEG